MTERKVKTVGLRRTSLIVLGASVAGGLISGVLSAITGLPLPVAFAVIFPAGSLLAWQLIAWRRAADEPRTTPATAITLLDARVTWRRLLQTVLPVAGTLVAAGGIAQLVRADSVWGAWAGPAAVVGVALVVVSMLFSVSWEVSYKGHRIRFQNHPCLAERLFIDGTLVDRGGIGVVMTLRGTIQSGDGAGDRIIATSRAGLTTFSCRIVAQPPQKSG